MTTTRSTATSNSAITWCAAPGRGRPAQPAAAALMAGREWHAACHGEISWVRGCSDCACAWPRRDPRSLVLCSGVLTDAEFEAQGQS